MTLKVRGGRTLDEPTKEFLKWVEDLKRVRNEFEALLNEYDEKRQRLIQAIHE
jgi:hypothetical protein